MFAKKSMIIAFGAAVGALGAFGDAAELPQSFEGMTAETAVTELTGWGGYGTCSNTANDRVIAAGYPIAGNHLKELEVEGWVTSDLTQADPTSSDRQLDMLVRVSLPDEALDGMSETDAKFAIAVDKTDTENVGELKYWTGSAWAKLYASKTFAEGQWIRLAVVYDSTGKKCKVSVDADAATTGNATASSADATLNKGPWYPVLDDTMTTITSMKVVGTTALDDITLGTVANADYTPSYKDASGNDITVASGASGDTYIPLAWYDKNNVPTNCASGTTAVPDGSGMTAEAKYITGVPCDGSKFELKAMEMTKDGDTVKAKVTLPVFDIVSSHEPKLQTKSDSGNWTDSDVTFTSGGTAEISLGSGNVSVTRFRLIAKPSDGQEPK